MADVGATAALDFPPSPDSSVCGFHIGLPRFSFAFILPSISLIPLPPLPFLGFALSCDLSKPIDITADLKLPFGGGRTPNNDPDPDDDDDFP